MCSPEHTVDHHPRPEGSQALGYSAVATFLVLTAATVIVSRIRAGTFAYPLDDAYIHLAVAQNLALHGTWGVNPGHYESASSSPLWTLTLATPMAILRGAAARWLPLAIASTAGAWSVFQATRLIGRGDRRLRPPTVAAVAACLAIPVSVLAVSGMENTLHLALVLLSIRATIRILSGDATRYTRPLLFGVLVAATLTRYETVFVSLALAVAIFSSGRFPTLKGRVVATWRDLLIVASAPATAIIGYGLVNLSFGQGLLPNSVAAKAFDMGGNNLTLEARLHSLSAAPTMTVSILASLLLLGAAMRYSGREHFERPRVVVAMVALVTCTFQFVTIESRDRNIYWFRYHGYIVVLTVIALCGHLMDGPPSDKADRRSHGAFLVCLVSLLYLSAVQLRMLPPSSGHIARQQLPMAQFLSTSTADSIVAVNDLGVVAVARDGGVVDLMGLGDHEILQQRQAATRSDVFLDRIARERLVSIAVIYTDWFRDGVPSSWEPIEEWCIDDATPVVIGRRCITYFAVDEHAKRTLRTRLAEFHDRLPDKVHTNEL